MKQLLEIIEQKLKALREAEDKTTSANLNPETELKNILKSDYTTFVQKLGQNINDPKFKEAIKTAADKDPIKTSDIDAPVKNLKPSQNEIDVDKSLKYPLTDTTSAESLLKGGTVAIAGKKIVTGGGGKFIVDGHHRWSQAYVINPDIKISALDISNITNPIDGLKSTQLGIAADIGKVPVASVQGSNLLKMGEKELKAYVIKTITDEVLEVFKKYKKGDTKETVADFIWNNVKQMQTNNQPVAGAPKRDIMPQTDDAPQWKDESPVPAAISEEIKRWQKLANIIK